MINTNLFFAFSVVTTTITSVASAGTDKAVQSLRGQTNRNNRQLASGGGNAYGRNKGLFNTATDAPVPTSSPSKYPTASPTAAPSSSSSPTAPCVYNGLCYDEGSTCNDGQTETCCGETYISFECTCVADDVGKLVYSACLNTDACMLPWCESSSTTSSSAIPKATIPYTNSIP
eukprot:826870_1